MALIFFFLSFVLRVILYLYTDVSNAIRDLFLVIAARKGIEVFWMYVEGERLIYYNKLIYIYILN